MTLDTYSHVVPGMQRQATVSLTQRLATLAAAAIESMAAETTAAPNVTSAED